MHTYAILAWSVAIVCWCAAGILAQQLHSPIALGTDSSTVTDYVDANGLPAFHTDVTTVLASTSLAVLFYGVLSAMWAVLVVLVARGANWARITQTVLGVIGGVVVLAQALLSLRGSGSGAVLPGWLDLVALLAIAAAILAMYLPAANSYFARRPPGAPRPAPLLPRPVVVTRAVWLFVVSAGLDLVANIVQLSLRVQPQHTSGVAVSGRSWVGTIDSVAGVAFSLALQAVVIVFLLRAAGWARVVATIVVALGVVYLPFSLILNSFDLTPAIMVSWVASPVLLVLQVIALVLLYRPTANAFFTAGAGIPVEGGEQTS